MSAKNPWLRKIADIRHHYGDAAAFYFSENPMCFHCYEERLVCLNIHHVYGKNVEEFKTLCFNCHMVEHSSHPDYTFRDYQTKCTGDGKAALRLRKRDKIIIFLRKKGKSLRRIGNVVGLSHIAVRKVLGCSSVGRAPSC